jgi:hypothetical protein
LLVGQKLSVPPAEFAVGLVSFALVAWRAKHLKIPQVVGASSLDGIFVVDFQIPEGSLPTAVHAAVILVLAEPAFQVV